MSLDPLLPGELRDDHDGRRSVRDWVVDGLMYFVAALVSAAVLADTWDEHSTVLVVVDLAIGAAAFVALWWRRSHPGVLALALTVVAVISPASSGPAVIAGFNVAVRGSRRALLAVLAATAVTIPIAPLVYPPSDGYVLNLVVGVLITAVVFGWGLFIRARRELIFSLRERAERLEREQRLRVEQAREAERRRIAGEMHDVLAHRVSLLTLHAGALEFRPDASPEEVAEAAGVIRRTAHAALEELRGVIGVLRDGADGEAPEPPQPTLADIPALVEESRAAGMKVEARIADPPAPITPALGRTAYRIVQEGLTNARKHAAAAAVCVHVGPDADGALVVQVVTRRPIAVAPGAADVPAPGGGLGLVGLAERVALAGGTLRHGPDGAGDFELRATLPT
jgi:signal transduction histidine kinase